jgi:F-type H+-transporting ATPase subunit b
MRRTSLLCSAVLLVLAICCAPVGLAADPQGEAHAKPGLLDVNVVVSAATVAVFVLLLVVLTKTAWKPILNGLQAREKGIRDQLEGAEKANADARALLADYQNRVAKANDEARAIVEEGRRDAEALKAKLEGDARAEAQKERDRALRDIELARQQALKDIYDEVATLSTDVAGRILQQRLDPQSHRKLVDDAVASYERSRKAPGGRA